MDQISTIERGKNVNGYSIFTHVFDLPDSDRYFLSHLLFSEKVSVF